MNLRRAAALLEVLGISLSGPLLMWGLRHLLGISITNPLNTLSAHATNAELLAASGQMFVLLTFQYAGYFCLIFPINWWYRRRRPADYGLTRAGNSWASLLLAGLATASLATWPALTIGLLNSVHPAETASWRRALFDMSWARWQFWLFTGVLSWAFVPIVEELYYRGYCQRRLADDWGNGPAIIGTACLFTFEHTQYFVLNPYSIGMICSLLIFAIGFGIVRAATGSLLPSILAHAIINILMTPTWQSVLLAAFIVGAIASWRRGAEMLKRVFSRTKTAACLALAIIGAAWAAIAATGGNVVLVVAVAMTAGAIGLEAIDRSRNRTSEAGIR